MPEPPVSALDLGTGAGVPGLVLALRWPDSAWVLLDGSRRRTALLEAAVAELGVADRVAVVCGRAEQVGHDLTYRGRFDLVTARSFGPPATTAECGAPFLRPGGVLVVSEPPGDEGGRWPSEGLAELGLVAGPARTSRPRAQVLEAVSRCPDRYPRRVGVPAKRPLF
ncbi:MAG TPA: RsmG family class I SAM-dependent methyltransferase [Acidimicrobiales bacterium]|nr:RsmG family class I SAM-dependent methyltransferase [Acidimicrobiales bacterium]